MNTVNLIGRIVKDVELRQTQTGKSVVQFTLAVSRTKEETDFINCVAWNQTAELLATYTHKGSLIGIEGRIQTRNYDNNQGQKVYVTEVIANRIEFLEPRSKSESKTEQAPTNTYQKQNHSHNHFNEPTLTEMAERSVYYDDEINIQNDDLPF